MSNTQYAVCHLQRGSGNDSGMSCHIERKDAKGKKYVPDNADAGRTHLNRELVRFPEGVSNRTEAIQHRIDTAGLRRKVGKNQTKAIRVILTGTHEQMMEIANGGRLDSWIDANLKWLRETFGNENLVSCVLHMDEKTPHLHATVVPIVAGERVRRKREGERKYETKSGPRLSADDVMRRTKLHEYQNSYAAAMEPFGLQRGIVGSTAKHQANSDYYRQQVIRYEEDIAKLQADVEKAQEGRNTILSWFGKGDLAKAKKELSDKDEEIAGLNKRLKELQAEKARLAFLPAGSCRRSFFVVPCPTKAKMAASGRGAPLTMQPTTGRAHHEIFQSRKSNLEVYRQFGGFFPFVLPVVSLLPAGGNGGRGHNGAVLRYLKDGPRAGRPAHSRVFPFF